MRLRLQAHFSSLAVAVAKGELDEVLLFRGVPTANSKMLGLSKDDQQRVLVSRSAS